MINNKLLKKYNIKKVKYINIYVDSNSEIPVSTLLEKIEELRNVGADLEKSRLRIETQDGYDGYGVSDVFLSAYMPKTDKELQEDINRYEELLKQQKIRQQEDIKNRERHERTTYLRLKKKFENDN